MEQGEFIDRLVDGTKPACGLEALELDGNHHLCKHHKRCDYKEEQKGGAMYCTFESHIRALADAVVEPEYMS